MNFWHNYSVILRQFNFSIEFYILKTKVVNNLKFSKPVKQQQQSTENISTIDHPHADNTLDQDDHEDDQDQQDAEINETININEVVTYSQLPPIRPKDKSENQTDSLLIIDGRSFRIQPDVRRLIKIYYHDHELFCDTRTKDVYVDSKRVYKMGDTTKEIILNGRRVRLMYMGKRIELWIDGTSFHFRADSPPKQIALTSSQSALLKRFWVTVDSRTMDMYFNNYKVCKIGGGVHGNGPSIINARISPDDYETHEISFVCPPKRIMIDGVPRKMRYDLAVPCIEMDNGQFHVIRCESWDFYLFYFSKIWMQKVRVKHFTLLISFINLENIISSEDFQILLFLCSIFFTI